MQKQNGKKRITKFLTIIFMFILLLLLTQGSVRAETEDIKWTAEGNDAFGPQVNKIVSGTEGNVESGEYIKWEAKIKSGDGIGSGIGEGTLKIVELGENISKLRIPDKILVNGLFNCVSYSFAISEIEFDNSWNFSSLKEITLGKFIFKDYINGNTFKNCTELQKILVSEENLYLSSDDGVLYDKEKTTLIRYPVGKWGLTYSIPTTVTTVGESAFEDNKRIYMIGINSSVTTINKYAFKGCSNLIEVELLANLKEISEGMFYECTNLKSINLLDSLESIGNIAFAYSGLTHITIPKTTTTIGANSFTECSSLETVVLSKNTSSIGSEAFSKCNNNLVVYCYGCPKEDDYISRINANSTIIPVYIYCEGVNEESENGYVKINKYGETIAKNSQTEIKLLSHVYGLPVKELGEASFKGNTNIGKITLPKTIETMGTEVFCGCTNLNMIVLPSSIKNIPDRAFYKCESLSKVVIRKGSAIDSIGTEVFTGCSGNLIVYHDGENSYINEYGKDKEYFRIDNQEPIADTGYTVNDKRSATINLSNIRDNQGGSGAELYAISSSDTVEGVKETEWQPVSDNITVNLDVEENGTWYIYIADMVGNTQRAVKDITGIDETKPQVKEDLTKEYSKDGATIKVTIIEETDGSGLNSYALTTSSELTTNMQWKSITGYEYQMTEIVKTNGIWNLFIRDNAGNINSIKIIVDGIDNEKPVFGNILKEPNGTKYVTITVDVSDDGCGLFEYAIDLNSETNENTKWKEIKDNPKTYQIKEIVEANGTYYIHVRDRFENEATTSTQVSGIVDTIAPRIIPGEKINNIVKVNITDANGIAAGAKISYAWRKVGEEAPEIFTPVEMPQYEAGAKEVTFEVDGSGEGKYYLWLVVEELKDINENGFGKIGEAFLLDKVYEFDTVAPTISNVEISKTIIKNGETTIITITTSEKVEHVETVKALIDESVAAEGCQLTDLTGEGTSWQLTLTAGAKDGEVKIILPKDIFKDLTGNTLTENYITNAIQIDNTAPTLPSNVNISKPVIKDGEETSIILTVEEVLVIDENKIPEITLTDGALTGEVKEIKSDDGKTWTITVIGGSGDGDVKLKLPEGLFKDVLGNDVNEIVYEGLSFDNTAPKMIEKDGPNPNLVNKSSTSKVVIKFDEPVTLNTENNIEVKPFNAEYEVSATVVVNKKDQEGKEWEITVTNCTGDADTRVVIPANTFIDIAGNVNSIEETAELIIDNTAPEISSIGEVVINETEKKATLDVTLEKLEEGLKYLVSTSDKIENEANWLDVSANPIKIEFTNDGTYYIHIKDKVGNIVTTEAINIEANFDSKPPQILDTKYEPTDEGIKVTIIADEKLKLPDGWKYEDDKGTIISKIYTEGPGESIIIEDISGNKQPGDIIIGIELVASVILDKTTLTIEPGKSEKITATVNPKSATIKDVTWKSNNESVAKVDKDGNITALAEGEAIITVTTNQGNKVAECKVIVKKEIPVDNLTVKLVDGSKSELDEINKYIKKISPNTKIDDALKQIDTNGVIKIYKGTEKITDTSKLMATGMTIKITKGEETKEYTAIVIGDTNGDGKADISDILQINKHRLNSVLLTGPWLSAGDVNQDGEADISDIFQINKHRLSESGTL